MNKYFKILLFILISQSVGIIGSFFTSSSVGTWYTTINKPFFNPPGWLFGPVWITLYTLIGISFYLLWQERKKNRNLIYIFIIHLVLNALWSITFFGAHLITFAFVNILLLLASIIYITIKSYKIDRRITWMFLPYLLWVSFASLLNFSFIILN